MSIVLPNGLRVAYILSRFPDLTQTFVMREMHQIRKHNIEVCIFSLLDPLPAPVHRQAEDLMPNVHYSPMLLSWGLIEAQFRYLFRAPMRYLRALLVAIRQTCHEPLVLARVLLLYPKCVYLARQMEKLGIDHIHAHFVWINGVAAAIASELTGITHSLHPHAFGLFTRDPIDVCRQLEQATTIIAISEFHRAHIAKLCPSVTRDAVKIVHLGLATDRFLPAGQPTNHRTLQILSVGSLIGKKGHRYLIDACALLAERGQEFRCAIVGIGPLRESLQARIEWAKLGDRVQLLGGRRQDQVLDLYRQSDVFSLACVVAPGGDRDGMPMVLIEAMAMQLPVVTTPVSGIPELVRHGENGLLVPEGDAQALALALEQLLQDEPLRHRLGRRGRKTVVQEYDIRSTAASLARIFREIGSRRQT